MRFINVRLGHKLIRDLHNSLAECDEGARSAKHSTARFFLQRKLVRAISSALFLASY